MSDPIKCNLTANVALRVNCERLLKEERVSVRSYGCSCVCVCVWVGVGVSNCHSPTSH